MSDLVMIRTFERDIVERFANSRVLIINGLTNEYHLPDPRRHPHLHRASRLDPGQETVA